ncbi:MAG TPA: hypothetical protein VHN80_21770, partial [Kineosporiaceae bacterium]|nr:hypothetical protein [Kineosporiaceae bacterium]
VQVFDEHRQEPWKAPLPVFIEDLYVRRFGRAQPEVVVPIEERHRQDQQRKAARRAARAAQPQQPPTPQVPGSTL